VQGSRKAGMVNEEALKTYLLGRFGDAVHVGIRRLGSGVQGTGFLVEIKTGYGVESYVVKTLLSEGLGHDYPSDRAAVFLLDLEEYKNLPKHVKAIDVLSEMEDGSVRSVGGGREYYLLMEKAEGKHYFYDLAEFSKKCSLEDRDLLRIRTMTSYLAGIHAVKRDSRTLYWRKLRDTVGHGECLMGVFDTYPDGVISYAEMAKIIKKSVDWVTKLKPAYSRLSQIHGDFHPGNIWFRSESAHPHSLCSPDADTDFVLLDRSRGPWGDPADDVTALTINYIFFSIKNYGDVRGAYLEGLENFFNLYMKASGDTEMPGVVAPFFAFRGAVVANPVFYPELTIDQRRLIFRFVHNVLDARSFEVEKINDYLR
jgi:hypothetical protein